jgi:CelD/BcsL family acetyltransferase involved in cellulose biosynthesis
LELTLYPDQTGFAALRDEWNRLLRSSRYDTIFLTWEWQSRWWDCIGSARGPLFILEAREGDTLVGILPLYRTEEPDGRTLHVVGCIEVSDYLDLIVAKDREPEVYAAFLDWLDGPNAPEWDVLDLCNQPAASLAHQLLPELARGRGWSAEVAQEDVCPIVTLPGDFDAYLECLDKKQRHEIRRKARRMEREAPGFLVRFVTQDGPGLDDAVEEFIRLHRLSSKAKDAFMDPDMQSFFHEIAHMAASRGWLQLAFLEVAGQTVAGYFNFTYGGDLLIYNSGFDAQAYPQLSPGWVLLAELFREASARGYRRVDFLQGNEDYKYRFGGVDTFVYRTLIRPAGR